MNDQIIENVNSLVSELKKSKEFIEFELLKESLFKREDLMKKINKIKYLQKIAVNKQNKKIDTTEEDSSIKKLLEELEDEPIYVEFENHQIEIDNILQTIKTAIEYEIIKYTNPKR